MKVNQTGSTPVQSNEASKAKGPNSAPNVKKTDKSAASGRTSKASPDDTRAEISSRGKEFSKARDVAASAPEVREDKIAELKQRIASGAYKVDSNAIADRMVDEHLRTS